MSGNNSNDTYNMNNMNDMNNTNNHDNNTNNNNSSQNNNQNSGNFDDYYQQLNVYNNRNNKNMNNNMNSNMSSNMNSQNNSNIDYSMNTMNYSSSMNNNSISSSYSNNYSNNYSNITNNQNQNNIDYNFNNPVPYNAPLYLDTSVYPSTPLLEQMLQINSSINININANTVNNTDTSTGSGSGSKSKPKVNGNSNRRIAANRGLAVGVSRLKKNTKNPFIANAAYKGKPVYIGCFPNPEAAAEAIRLKKIEFETTPPPEKKALAVRALPKGVYIFSVNRSRKNPYEAKFNHNGVQHRIGSFPTIADAEAALVVEKAKIETNSPASDYTKKLNPELPRGVNKNKRNGPNPYQTRLTINGKQVFIGYFATPELAVEAIAARRAEEELKKSNSSGPEPVLIGLSGWPIGGGKSGAAVRAKFARGGAGGGGGGDGGKAVKDSSAAAAAAAAATNADAAANADADANAKSTAAKNNKVTEPLYRPIPALSSNAMMNSDNSESKRLVKKVAAKDAGGREEPASKRQRTTVGREAVNVTV